MNESWEQGIKVSTQNKEDSEQAPKKEIEFYALQRSPRLLLRVSEGGHQAAVAVLCVFKAEITK